MVGSQDEEKHSSPPAAIRTEQGKQPRDIHGIRWAVAVGTILSSTFFFALDNTIVAAVQASILKTMGTIEQLPWLGVAFALGGVTILPWSKVYGIFNVKWLFISSVILFEAGSALCGAAPTMEALIVGRALAGVGGGGMYSGCLFYLSVTTSTKERSAYMSSTLVAWGLGTVLGPVIGGAFADSKATWRWAFYINLVVAAVLSPGYLWSLPAVDFQPDLPFVSKLKQMDWLGILVYLAGTSCFTLALTFGGSVFEWSSPAEIVFWVFSGVLLIVITALTVYHPLVAKKDRLYPGHFLRRPLIINLQIQIFLLSGVNLTVAYYIPLYFQFTRNDSALQAGVRLLPYIAMMVVFSMINGMFMTRFGYYLPWYLAGTVLTLVGAALMYTTSSTTSTGAIYGFTALIGIGLGLCLQAGFAVVQSLVPPEDIPNTVGFMSLAQDFGVVFVLGIAGCIYNNLGAVKLGTVLETSSKSEIEKYLVGTSSEAFQSLASTAQAAIVDEIIRTMKAVWALLIASAAICVVLTFLLKWKKITFDKVTH